MPTLKKRSGKASRNGRMSVYLPRSAVSPTMSGRARAERGQRLAERRLDASAGRAGRLVLRPWPACGRLPAAAHGRSPRSLLELGDDAVPLAGVDAEEMRLLALLDARHALAGQRAQHDRLRPAVAARAPHAARRRSPPCRCRRSPPSSQPKARHLSATGSMSSTTGPSAWMPLQSISATRLSSPKWLRRHRRLPGRALLHLAVGELDEDARRRAVEPQPERLADRLAEAVAERAADHLDARRGVERRHLQPAVVGAVGGEFRRPG